MKTKTKLAIAAMLLALCGGWVVFVLLERQGEKTREENYFKMLEKENRRLREALKSYYYAHRRYPATLAELSLPEPASQLEEDALEKFSYTSLESFYILTWAVQWGDGPVRSHKEHATKGKVIFVEEYINGELTTRIEYPGGLGRADTRIEKRYENGRLTSIRRYRNGREVTTDNLDQ